MILKEIFSAHAKQKQNISNKIKYFLTAGVVSAFLFLPQIMQAATIITPTVLQPATTAVTTAKPLIAGVSVNDTVVEIYIDDILVATPTTVNNSSGVGSFSWQVTNPLGIGEHTLKIRAGSLSMQEFSDYSVPRVISTVPFGEPTLLIPDELILTKPFSYIQGVAHNNSTIKVYIDGVRVDTFELGSHATGAVGFKQALNTPLTTGRHAIYLIAVDPSGRESLPTQTKIVTIVDLPAPTLLTPASDARTYKENQQITGVAVNGSLVKIYVNGKLDGELKVKDHASGVAYFVYQLKQKLNRGAEQVITATGQDINGRVSQLSGPVSFFLEYLYIPPTLVRIKGTGSQPTVGGVAHNDSLIHIYVDGTLNTITEPANHESGTLYFEVQLTKAVSAGTHKIAALAYDDNGKPSEVSNALYYTYEIAETGTGGPVPVPGTGEDITTPTTEKPEPVKPVPTVPPADDTKPDDITVKEDDGKIVPDTEVPGSIEPGDGDVNKVDDTGIVIQPGTESVTNWPLVLGLAILIGLAIIFIIWYLGQKRRLLNEGIDKLFSEEDESMSPPMPSQPKLLDDELKLPEEKMSSSEPTVMDAKDDRKARKPGKDSEKFDDIPPPPPSI